MEHTLTAVEPPQPAPRKLNSQLSSDQLKITSDTNGTNETSPVQNHKKATPTSSLEGDDAQVLPKPITNEQFQAMIPAHFLKNPPPTSSEPTHAVTVTIKKPDLIELPPAPTGPGRVTETITKSTFTETVVTRITDNKLVMPLIIEVWQPKQHQCM